MAKITIVGAGNVGSQAAFYAALEEIDEIVLIDVQGEMAKGKALDIQQAMSVSGSQSRLCGGDDYSLADGSDIVVITAGIARKPGMSRDDLIDTNKKIVSSVVKEIKAHAPDSILIIVSNPLDVMVQVAYKESGFPKQRVIGMAGVLDTARLKAFLAMETGAKTSDIEAMVLGGHGDLMVPLESQCTINGRPVSDLVAKDRLEQIFQRTRDGGAEIVSLLKTGSAFFAPGLSVIDMVLSILDDEKKLFPCAVLLEGEYGEKGIFAGVPVILGKGGAEKIVELPLTAEEKKAFRESAAHVRKLVEKV